MKISITSMVFVAMVRTVPAKPDQSTVHLKPTLHKGPVQIETLSVPGNLDGFKINTSTNSSSFDYWWFDLLSEKDDAALNVVFYNAGDIGNPQPLAVEISGSWPNGTTFWQRSLEPEGAEISNCQMGISGEWKGLRAKFSGTSLSKPNVNYRLEFDSPALGIMGKVKLNSRAPPHYPCNPNIPGANQLHMGRFFWSNAIPDADVEVNVKINGTLLKFKGTGYHDKNWGDETVLKSAKFWDWGHTRVGPYSVVWYDLLDYNDVEYHRSYIAQDNKIHSISCADNAVVTRPWGGNEKYPSRSGLHGVKGVVSRFDIGNGDALVVNVTKKLITYSSPGAVYTRAIGSSEAYLESTGETYSGKAFFDQFVYGLLFPPPS